MIAFIEEHRGDFGVEPIRHVLQIAPATFHRHAAVARNPELASDRARQDAADIEKIKAAHGKSRGRYGVRKVWHQLRRDGHDIARCTVERLMRLHGLQGGVRGQKKTTIPDPAQPCPDDKVNRQFVAARPNQLWVSDFSYVSTWAGMVYVAFIIDVFARKIVGWRVSTSMTTSFVLDALNRAICQRCPTGGGLVHHSDRGSQYLSIRYTERLADAGIDTSVGSVGDSYDNALAESIIGLFKTEVINFLGPWKSTAQVEWETLQWVSWYNNERLHGAIGHRPPQDVENAFYERMNALENAAWVLTKTPSRKPGAVQGEEGDRTNQQFLDSFKTLLKDARWPLMLILSGIPSLATHIVREEQLTRLLRVVHFKPIDLTQQSDMDEMVQLTFSQADKAGLDFEPLATTDFIERLAFTCCDRWGLVIEMLIEAFTSAVVEGETVCSVDHFTRAYATLYGGTAGYSPLTAPNYRDSFDQQVLFDMFERMSEKKGPSGR